MATMYESLTLDIPIREVVDALRKGYGTIPHGEKPTLTIELIPSSGSDSPQCLRLKWCDKKEVHREPETRAL